MTLGKEVEIFLYKKVDMSWKDGKVTEWKLRSQHRQRVKVLVNGETHEMML